MKIDVIVGNPPYQESTGGGMSGGTAIYPKFIDMGKSIEPKRISLITPSRYFTGGQGITTEWKEKWLNDLGISNLVHFPLAEDIFNDTSIAGGVSYFLWENNLDNNGETDKTKNIVRFENRGTHEKEFRQLNKFSNFITDNVAKSIMNKVMTYMINNGLQSLDKIMLPRADGYYGLGGGYKQEQGDIIVRQFAGDQKCYRDQLKNQPKGYRVYTAGKIFDRTELVENNTVLSSVKILNENEVCNGSYILFDGVDDISTAENIRSYLRTKLIRLLILKNANGNNISRDTFYIVPLLNFNKTYTDEKLYSIFNIDNNEIEYINRIIKTLD